MDLSIANVINISVATPQGGVGAYNTSNLALFSKEVPAASFGSLGYKIYLSPTEVGVDFGTSSKAFAMANAVFSQQPNILAGGGYLVIITMETTPQTAVQTITFPAVPASGVFQLDYNAENTTDIQWDDDAATIEGLLQALTGLGSVTVAGSIASQSLVVTFTGVVGPATLLVVENNTLADATLAAVVPVPADTVIGAAAETLDVAINRTLGLVQYFGIMSDEVQDEDIMLLAAASVQALNKLAFFVSFTDADVAPGGKLDKLRTGSFTQSRGLFYKGSQVLQDSLVMMASYIGRGLSVNFNGSLTTITMHLKTLSGVQPDSAMDQTLLDQCKAAGADTYVSIQGVPKTFTSGANDFFDNQYNLQWFAGALTVEGFNVLAQVSTKVPQTEGGMDTLKGAYRRVCEQGVVNQFVAPGKWTSPTTFGVQQDLLDNIEQLGYYIYSVPVSQQLPAERVGRVAPLVQIAIKYAGALHSSSVIVNINP